MDAPLTRRGPRPTGGPWRVRRVVQPCPAGLAPAARPGGSARSRHRILPATASLVLIVNTIDCPTRPAAFVHAPHDRPMQFDGECSASYIQVSLSPPAALRVLGVPLGSLGDGLVDVRDLFGRIGRQVVERVREEGDVTRQIALVEEGLTRRLHSGSCMTPEVGHVWRRLTATGGCVAIEGLTREIGWTHQHLISEFRRDLGMTPKTAARLLRLDRVWRSLDRFDDDAPGSGYRWADIAAETGYTDQSHLIREFRRFTGTTPICYLANRLPGEHGGPLRATAGQMVSSCSSSGAGRRARAASVVPPP